MATVKLGDNDITTSGELPAVGSKAPDFTVTGIDLSPISLGDYKGMRLILNIFPSIDTGVCAASARRFNEEASSLENTVVLNVSRDLPMAHKRFCAAEGLENVHSGSEFGTPGFSINYHVVMENGKMKDFFSRAVVVIDEKGIVTYTEQVPSIGQEPDYESALAAL